MPEGRGHCGESGFGPLRRRVVRLAGQHHRPVVADHDHRLVTRDVPGRRDDMDTRCDLGLAVEELVRRSVEVDELRERVVAGPSGVELQALCEQRSSGEAWIAADVVEVQVAVDH